MEHRQFGSTGLSVMPLGFGGAEIGFGGTEFGEVERFLNAALDDGLNVIDTAECYKDSEEKIGKAIGHRREEYHLFTKCGHSSGIGHPDWSRELLTESIDRSLQRLQTDRVDLVMLHSCNADILKEGVGIEVLQRAKEAGKTRLIGYSGDSATARLAVELGVFDVLETSCNIADQESIDLTLPLANEKGMGLIVKRPVANVAWKHADPSAAGYAQTYCERLQKLAYTEPLTVETALRFALAQPVGVCIVGMSTSARWKPNLEIVGKGPLEPEKVAEFRRRWKEVAPSEWVGQE